MWPALAAGAMSVFQNNQQSGGQPPTAASMMFGQNQSKKQAAPPTPQTKAVNAFNQASKQLPELPQSQTQAQPSNPNPMVNSAINAAINVAGQPPALGSSQHPWAKHPLFSSLVPSNFSGNAVLNNPSNSNVGYQQGQYDDIAQLAPLLAGLGMLSI